MTVLEEVLRVVVSYLVVFVETCGAFVITVGVVRTMAGYCRSCVLRHQPADMAALRITLGKSLVLALEFQVAADILKTGLSPTWQDILQLSAILAVRTVMNILLERELALLDHDHPAVVGRSARDD